RRSATESAGWAEAAVAKRPRKRNRRSMGGKLRIEPGCPSYLYAPTRPAPPVRAAPLLLAFVLLLGAAAEPPPGGSPAPAADTLRFAMPSGEALVTVLPADGSYRV